MNARPSYITPTQLGEEAYQAAQQRRPRMRRPYRPVDGNLLARAARAAFEEHRTEQLPDHERAAVAACLADEMERVFPQNQMKVLELWRCAQPWRSIIVSITSTLTERIELPRTVLALTGGRAFEMREFGGEHVLRVPAPCRPFFERIAAIDAEQHDHFTGVSAWPSRFKHEHRRFPTWGEIAAAWPRLAKRIEAL